MMKLYQTKKLLMLITFFVLATPSILAQTSAFIFQGTLNDNSTSASGTYQMKFSLFDSGNGGTQIGQTIEIPSVEVVSGQFGIKLDFGASPFDGSARFLQIEVRRNSAEPYVALTPRQQLTSAPYSFRAAIAQDAATLGGIPGSGYAEDSEIVRNGTAVQKEANFNISGTGQAGSFDASTGFRILGFQVLSLPGNASNLAVGSGAGASITDAFNTTLVGAGSGLDLTSGNSNAFFGNNAGRSSTVGLNNTFIGSEAGLTTTGFNNTFVGSNSGKTNTTGRDNVFVGTLAGANNTTGYLNTFVGLNAGISNEVGDRNVFIGSSSGALNSIGYFNTFLGADSGSSHSSGNSNVFVGQSAGSDTTAGSGNVFVGRNAGRNNTIGSNNTMIGHATSTVGDNLNYATAIGSDTVVSSSNTIVLGRPADRTVVSGELNVLSGSATQIDRGEVNFLTGSGNFDLYIQGGGGARGVNFGVDSANSNGAKLFISQYDGTTYQDRLWMNEFGVISIGTLGLAGATSVCRNASLQFATCSSSIRYKDNIARFSSGSDIISRLRPVTFAWKDSGVLDLGLVAEEVAEIEPLLVTYNTEGQVEGVKYDRIGVVLVNVVKEQAAELERQKEKVKGQKAEIESLREELKIENGKFEAQGDLLQKQGVKIETLEAELAALKALVCSSNPDADVCQR